MCCLEFITLLGVLIRDNDGCDHVDVEIGMEGRTEKLGGEL